MIKKLIVKNFAILEDIEINFYDGLTILTGETGAGKSLSSPFLIISMLALSPSNKEIESIIKDFPAPVSPVRMVKPS